MNNKYYCIQAQWWSQLFLMSDILLCSGLVAHFAQRFKHYLLFLQFSNDHDLIQLLLGFLHLKDVLNFLATSSHFRELRKMQSVQIRILREKISFYEKPKELGGLDVWLRWLPMRLADQSNPALISLKQEHLSKERPKPIAQMISFFKKGQVLQNKEPSKKTLEKEDLRKQEKQLESILQSQPKKSSWSQVNDNQTRFLKQYVEQVHEKSSSAAGKKIVEYNSNSSNVVNLDAMEYYSARQDYEQRKMRMRKAKGKGKDHSQFISLQDLKKLAERDSCTRRVLNSVYEEERIKEQQENISKLRMRPTPNIHNIKVEAIESQSEVKVLKQSIAGKVFSGIKSMMFMKN